jgi:aspartate aminotransferase-like enzyme
MTEPIRFFLPGPTYVPMDAREAMTKPLMGHRSAAFKELYVSLAARLPKVLRTAGDGMIATGSSTLLMESAIVSLVREDVLHLVCGAFSERWFAISKALGRAADKIEVPLGQAIDPETVRAALRRKKYEAVALVHNETATGVVNPLQEIARVIREESDALVLVDTVSSLAGAPVETDAWGLDVTLAGVQKALAVPPGLTVFAMSDRAYERAKTIPHRGFYTDLVRYRDKHREGGVITTPAVSLCFALDVQLDRILAEGMEARWERHRRLQQKTAAWAAAHGVEYATAEGARSWTVSCLKPPPGVAATDVTAEMRKRGFTLGGGYDAWKSSTFRIGHMGEVRESDLNVLFAALEEVVACTAS